MNRSRTLTSVFLLWLSVPLLAGDAKEFEDAWNKRRHVAPFIRCSVDIVRFIPAGSIGFDPVFPVEDTTVDQSYEYLFDTENRRLRFESHAWSGHLSIELRQYRTIWVFTSTSMKRFKFEANGTGTMGVPAIVDTPMDGRNMFSDTITRFSPPALAVGFSPTCGLGRSSVDASEFKFKTLDNGQVELTPVNEELDIRYITQPDRDWAVNEAFMLDRFTDGRLSQSRAADAVATWEKLPQGWYPTSWQEEIGSSSQTCRATWEFLENVDEALWTEPEGLRVPGNIVFTEKGRRKLDHDLALIPPDAYQAQDTNWWLRGLLIVVGIFLTIYVVRHRRGESL